MFSFYSLSTLWLVLLVGFLVLEGVTTALVSIWFAAGALCAFLVSLFTNSLQIQLVVFGLVTVVSLLATYPMVRKMRNKAVPKTNVGLDVGRVATVIQAIDPVLGGRVRLDGVDWKATCAAALPEGTQCIVDAINGTTLTVKPLEATAPVV